jgi:phosphatidylserine/phosphatidylglycerophosphate/cardiolipin synthase-like enzyme
MSDFENADTKEGLSMKLWRGERMCLIGFDVDAPAPADLVGFAIECRPPGKKKFEPLKNRLAFSYDEPVEKAVTGARKFDSTEAPFQKFRWVDFPFEPGTGTYRYRGTAMHMPADGKPLEPGTSIELDISLAPVTYDGFLDVGFTRGFASSQAFRDKAPEGMDVDAFGRTIIPDDADAGLDFTKATNPSDIYDWLGFEAYDLIFSFLDEVVADPTVTVDVFAYDLNEPDIVGRLERLGNRLRVIIDDSTSKTKKGVVIGHGIEESAESKAAKRLRKSAGEGNVHRTHFKGLQHHKVLIAKRNGVPFKVLGGSTNFSFRGVYIQSNNVLVFDDPDVAGLFGKVFDAAFEDPARFASDELATKWHTLQSPERPPLHFCFSPHRSSDFSLNPVRGAIEQASSSVLYAVAFLSQIKSGPTEEAFARLIKRPVFSYGIANKRGKLQLQKPDGSIGLVDFDFLAANAPEPFKSEWSGGQGINVHHKFVVTDFSLPTAKVFTGSSNLAPSGEQGNGDHLILIEDRKIAVAYAIEALRVFDHLHFRDRMKEAAEQKKPPAGQPKKKGDPLTLRKPTAISGEPAWFEEYYVADSQKERDRILFAR